MLWPMAKLVTLLEQNSDRQPPTVVIQATIWWETALVYVKPQKGGLGVYLPAGKCFLNLFVHYLNYCKTMHLTIYGRGNKDKAQSKLYFKPQKVMHPLTARCKQSVFKPRSKIYILQ